MILGKILRALFLLTVGCVWLIVLGLALEALGALCEAQAVRDYNRAVRDMKMPPAGMKQVPAGTYAFDRKLPWTPIKGKPTIPGKTDSLLREIAASVCDPAQGGPADISEDVRAERIRFASVSDANLNAVATRQGDWVALMDHGVYLCSWGDPLIEELSFWRFAGQTPPFVAGTSDPGMPLHDPAAQNNGPIMLNYTLFGCNMPMAVRTFERPIGSDADVVELLVRDTTRGKDLAPFLMAPVPSDSIAEIPGWGYRKHWREKPDGPTLTNNFGFYEHDVVVPRPADRFRIVCVGASTTWEGADRRANAGSVSYPKVLEQELQRDIGTAAIEVLNCGVVALNSDCEVRRINDYLDQDPNLLLYYNGINDIAFMAFPALCSYRSDTAKWLERSRFMRHFFNGWLMADDDTIESFLRARTIRNLDAMAFAARERHVDVVLCSFAYPEPRLLDRRFLAFLDMNIQSSWCGGNIRFRTYCRVVDLLNGLIAELCKERGLIYAPVAENMHGGTDCFVDACHMSPNGRERKARIIADAIREHVKSVIQTQTTPAPAAGGHP